MADADISNPSRIDDSNAENANVSNTEEPKRKTSIPQRKARATKIKQPSSKVTEDNDTNNTSAPTNGQIVDEKASVAEDVKSDVDLGAEKEEQVSPRGVRRGRATKVIKKPPPDLEVKPAVPAAKKSQVEETQAVDAEAEPAAPIASPDVAPNKSTSSDELFTMSNTHDASALQDIAQSPTMAASNSQAFVASSKSKAKDAPVEMSEELVEDKPSIADDKPIDTKEEEPALVPSDSKTSISSKKSKKDTSIAQSSSQASLSEEQPKHLTASDSKASVASHKSDEKKLGTSNSNASIASTRSKASDKNVVSQNNLPALISSDSKVSVASRTSIGEKEDHLVASDSKGSISSHKSTNVNTSQESRLKTPDSVRTVAVEKIDVEEAAAIPEITPPSATVDVMPALASNDSKISVVSRKSTDSVKLGTDGSKASIVEMDKERKSEVQKSESRASLHSAESKHDAAITAPGETSVDSVSGSQESRLKTPDSVRTIAVEKVAMEEAAAINDVTSLTATVDVIPVVDDDGTGENDSPRINISAATPPPVLAPPVEAPPPKHRAEAKPKKSKVVDTAPPSSNKIKKRVVGEDAVLPEIKAKPRPPPEERHAVNPRQNRLLKAAAEEAEKGLPDVVGKKVKKKKPVVLPPMEQRVVESAPLVESEKPKLAKAESSSAQNSPIRKKVKKKSRRPLYIRLMAEGLKKQNQWEKEKMEKYEELKQKKVQPSKAEIDAHMARYKEMRRARLENEEEQARILKGEWKRKQKELKKMEYAVESPLKQLVIHSDEARASKDADEGIERKQRVDKGKEYANIVRDLFQPPPPLVRQAANTTPRKKLNHDLEVALQDKEELLSPQSPLMSPLKRPPKKESPIHKRVKYERQNSGSPRAVGQDWVNEIMSTDPEEAILAEMYETGFAMLMIEKGIISASR